jgi:hypothetical protein
MLRENIQTHFEALQGSDQQDDVRDMGVLHGIHPIKVEPESVLLELFERLINPQGICMVRVGIDDCVKVDKKTNVSSARFRRLSV